MLDAARAFQHLRVLLVLLCALFAVAHAEDRKKVASSSRHTTSNLSSQISDLKDELIENPENAEARYNLGVLNLQLGSAIAAEKEFRRAQQYGLSSQLVLPLLGEAMLPQQKYLQVLDDISVDATYPKSINAQILGIRGQAELGLNELLSAEETLQAGAAADPDARAVLLGRLGVYQEKKDYEAFKTTMTRALVHYPENQQLLLWQGLSALTDDKVREAEAIFQRVIDHEPADLSTRWERQARFWLVQAYIRMSEFDKAEKHIKRLLKLDLGNSLTHYLGAIVAFEKGAYDLARNRLVKVLDRHPEMPSGRLLLGVTYYAQGNYEQAAYEISSYLVLNSKDSWAQELLIKSYLQLNDFDRASAAIEGWTSRDAENIELAELISLNALYSGKPERAIRYLKAVESKQTSQQILLVSAYLAAGEADQLSAALAALSENTSVDKAYSVIIDSLMDKQWSAALDGLQQLPTNLADTVPALSLLGSLQVLQGDKKAAISLFKKGFMLQALGEEGLEAISRPADTLPNQSQSEALAKFPAELHGVYRRVGSWEEITNGIGANSPYTYSLWAENPFSQWMRDEGVFAVSLVVSEGTDEQLAGDGLGHLIEKPVVLLDSKLPPFMVLVALFVIIGLRIVSGMRK